jgi:hypothetical protein
MRYCSEWKSLHCGCNRMQNHDGYMNGPMKTKVKWPIKELLARRQWRLLKGWLRYTESLRDIEEVVHVCEPEDRINFNDDEEDRSLEDVVNCQEGSEESLDFHMGNEMGSLEDPIYC